MLIPKTNTNQPDSVPQKNNAVLFKYKCDVSSKTQLDSLFDFAKEKLGDIDLFIANAGFAYYEKIEGADWNHISKIFETNVMSFIYCAEKMKELHGEKPYNFVVTGSSMGLVSMPGYSLYSATKAAVRGFADSYRLELSKGQHFQVVFPIATKTKFFSTAANNTPVPFPTQTPEAVAKKIIHGIKKNINHIFPSTVFSIMNFLNRFLPFISKIYVSSMASVQNGRANWAIPKELADFKFTKLDDNTEQITITQPAQNKKTSSKKTSPAKTNSTDTIAEFTIKSSHLHFPVSTKLMPFPLVQKQDDKLFFTNFFGKGLGKFAKMNSIKINSSLFPDISLFKPLAVIKVDPFNITFPKSTISNLVTL